MHAARQGTECELQCVQGESVCSAHFVKVSALCIVQVCIVHYAVCKCVQCALAATAPASALSEQRELGPPNPTLR